jgi:hypothetical protein
MGKHTLVKAIASKAMVFIVPIFLQSFDQLHGIATIAAAESAVNSVEIAVEKLLKYQRMGKATAEMVARDSIV